MFSAINWCNHARLNISLVSKNTDVTGCLVLNIASAASPIRGIAFNLSLFFLSQLHSYIFLSAWRPIQSLSVNMIELILFGPLI